MREKVEELRTRFDFLKRIARNPDIDEKSKFSQVFSDQGNGRIATLMKELNLEFSYYDPDCGYDEDVMAYITAMEQRLNELAPLLDMLLEAPAIPADTEWVASFPASKDNVLVASGDTEDAAIEALRTSWPVFLGRDSIRTQQVTRGKPFRIDIS